MNRERPRSDIPYDLLMQIQHGTMAHQYRGVPLQKNPFDLAIYARLLEQTRPRTVIEIGSYQGGSALWFSDQARLLDLDMGVLSIDLVVPSLAHTSSIRFLEGDATNLHAVLSDAALATLPRPMMVVEDSSHLSGTTAAVLDFFDRWLTAGEYLIVEDGILSDMRVAHLYDGGPLQAIDGFLDRRGEDWEIDRTWCDYFGRNVTWNVDGYLRRR